MSLIGHLILFGASKQANELLIVLCINNHSNAEIQRFINNNKGQIDINFLGGGNTALQWCCKKDNIDKAKLLIDNFKEKIDINVQGACDNTAFYLAVEKKIFVWLSY